MSWPLFIPTITSVDWLSLRTEEIMGKVLIIDDSDPAITYTGNWATLSSVGIQTGEYNATVHQSQSSAAGDQLSYTFEGTGITVYGTLDAPGTHGSPNPTFSIDGQTPTGFNSNSILGLGPNVISSYVPLYTSLGLTKGTHTLAISSGTPVNTSTHLNVDFLLVDTGSDSGSGNIIVDDRDTSIIYVGNWHDYGGAWEFGLTTRGSPNDAAGGTATFGFNGTSITIYGTTPSSGGANTTAVIAFAIDGRPSTQFNSPQNSGVIQHNPLFHVEGLSNTQEHSIVMTSLNTNSWWLDYIVYTTHNSSIAGGGGDSSGTSQATEASRGGEKNVGVIAGGVVAGVAALLAIAGIIIILLRSRKRKRNEKLNDKSRTMQTESHFDPSLEPSPFVTPATGPHAHANPFPSKRYDFNSSSHTLTSGAGERAGRALLDSTESTSYLGTQSRLSSLPRGMSQYSDGEPQQVLAAASGPEYGHQNPNNPLYPRFDRGVGEGVTSTYQRESRRDYDQTPGRPSGDKAQYIGQFFPASAPAVNTHRPRPSSVQSIEEDSGIRIPAKSPPVYTPE